MRNELLAERRWWCVLRAAGMAALVMSAAACESPADDEPDAALPSEYVVRGMAFGVLEPLQLQLVHPGGSESLIVSGDGRFVFEARLAVGAAYVVNHEGSPRCVIEHASGTIADVDPEIVLACDGAPLLDELVLSGPTAPHVSVSLTGTAYEVEVSLLQQSVTLTPVARWPGTTITIAGTTVTSGMPSQELPLALGANEVEIEVSLSGRQRTYRLTIHRAAALAQYAYGKASNTGADDQFGTSIALAGDTLAVGVYGEDSAATGVGGNQTDDSASNSGAVYVFRRTGRMWVQEAYLKASNTGADDQFGTSIALAGDILAVGAPGEASAAKGIGGDQTDDSVFWSGAVYVFRRTGRTWAQEAYLKASNTGLVDQFGSSVALAGDILAVGAPGEASAATGIGGDQADDSAVLSGAVYVFRRTDNGWVQEAYLKASNTGTNDNFGWSVALAGDTLAVGAWRESSAATGIGGNQADDSASWSGAVYVFRHTDSTWAQEAYLKASNTGAEDQFGWSVALAGDTLAVGAYGEDSAATGVGGNQDDDSDSNSGAVYVFRRTNSTWAQEAYVKASNTGAEDRFGWSVALAGDTLAVGARYESSAAAGVGGNQDDNGAANSGAVYVFRRTGSTWTQDDYLKASNSGAGDYFGWSVALADDTLAVGSWGEDSAATGIGGSQDDEGADRSGAMYIFH